MENLSVSTHGAAAAYAASYPESLGGYRLLERIGAGGMGTVFRAMQESLHREVAVKILSPAWNADARHCEAFENESRVIAALHEKVPSCPRALSDQFANEWVLKRALGQRHIPVQLEQRTKAESDVAVAAASILARARFVQWMKQTAEASKCPMPLGCAPHVTRAAKHFIETHGRERLQDVAKLHFKVTQKLQ